MDLLAPADWSFPVPISYGPGRIAELGALCGAAGMSKPMLVTDRCSADLPFIAAAMDSLRETGLQPLLHAGISPNPTYGDIASGAEAFRSGGNDGVVAIGGGSGMDGGKAISLIANGANSLWSFDFDSPTSPDLAASDFPPLICVPTTAGTGAETESTAMVTDSDRGVKVCVWHEKQRPTGVILDPALTVGLPQNLTAWTGVDALVHAIEAYSVPDWHPFCDGLAIEAIRLISTWLPLAVQDGSDLEARAAMLVGSSMAGVSFLKGLGLVHAMSHMVGAVYDTHHGLTNAVLLPPVLRYNRDALGTRTAVMAQAMGLADTAVRGDATAEAFEAAIDEFLKGLEIPTRLSDIGVGDDRLHELAVKSLGDAAAVTNPRKASVDDIEQLLTDRL